MSGIALLLGLAAVGFGIARATRIPPVPLLIAVGMLGSALLPLDSDFVGDALILGVTVLVFVAGVELNPERIRGRGRAILRVGFFQFTLLGGLGLAAALALGLELETAAYLGLALSASSTLVVIRILQQKQLLFEPIGRLVAGVLLLQDLLVILCIPIVTGLSQGWAEILRGVGATLVLIALAGVILRWVAPPLVQKLGFEEESLLLAVLSLLFAFMGLAHLFELPLISGAFLAGLALSRLPVAGLVRGQFTSLGDFFNALFFTALGAFLVLPTGEELVQALALTVLVVVVTPPIVAFLAERAGYSARPAIASGLLLAQTSEFSLVVGLQGVALGQIEPGTVTVIALVTVATMMLTPFIATDRVTWALVKIHPFKGPRPLDARPENHILLLGGGRNGISLIEELIITRYTLVVVDDDPALIQRLDDAMVPAVRGDASDIEVLREVGADRARIVISTIRRKEDNAPLLALGQGRPILVRAFNLEDARWIEERGGRPILYSDAAAEDFWEWYETEWEPASETDE